MPIAARKLRAAESLTPALLQSLMRKIFPKKNGYGEASFEELLPELARFNIKTRGRFVALMTHHRKRLLRIDSEPLDAWHERYYRSELGDRFVSDALRRRYWFAYPALIRIALELEFGDKAVTYDRFEASPEKV
ncbi:hypothetical protein [Variovorax paradoxus]|jgi:hypothetical protein|uniref:hypothetical protein n=1 Tax=Variovorax paradoxus TaxID=34073 RepID=UPI0029C785BC|nr:hypothetical protein [Variovorax paradoxus]WPH23489.1 hypothetical protein RZE78_31045 [Variovorax paradoxus]